jgi:hypothetical protein
MYWEAHFPIYIAVFATKNPTLHQLYRPIRLSKRRGSDAYSTAVLLLRSTITDISEIPND